MFHRNDGQPHHIERFNNVTISDCEILIYDTENDILRAIKWTSNSRALGKGALEFLRTAARGKPISHPGQLQPGFCIQKDAYQAGEIAEA